MYTGELISKFLYQKVKYYRAMKIELSEYVLVLVLNIW